MPIHYLEENRELEEKGKVELTLVGLRYVGDKSSKSVSQYQRQASWPGNSPLQGGPINDKGGRDPGPIQFGEVPDWTDDDVEDRTLVALENDPDVEVIYDPEELARALLERNYLPPDVFDRGYNLESRERVFEKLDLEDVGSRNVPGYREQLREIAGIDDSEDNDSAARDDSRVTEYKQDYTRPELMRTANELGKDGVNIGKTDLAEWLADQDAADVEETLDEVTED